MTKSYQMNMAWQRLVFGLVVALTVMAGSRGYADYNGTHVSCTGDTIPPGMDLSYDITVQNTGSFTWFAGGNPAWVHRVYSSDCSWSPKPAWSYTTGFHWSSVSGGATTTDSATFSADDLPSAPGTYTFLVYAYYPTDTMGNYSLMVDSPKQVTFTISDNSAPTDIAISSSSICENRAAGSAVGVFSTIDLDVGDTFTYTLVAGMGGDDNASFSIDGSNLLTSVCFNYEVASSRTVRVRTTDQGGLWYEEVFVVNIEDENETPALLGVAPTNGTDVVIRWSSVTNHLYSVYCSTNLLSGFTLLESNVAAVLPINSYTDTVSGVGQKFWRISTEP